MGIDINRLGNGDGIEATLMRQQAFWHKACRLKFNQKKLDQMNKKVALVEDPLSMQTCSIQSYVGRTQRCYLFVFAISLLVLKVFIMLPPMILIEMFVGIH